MLCVSKSNYPLDAGPLSLAGLHLAGLSGSIIEMSASLLVRPLHRLARRLAMPWLVALLWAVPACWAQTSAAITIAASVSAAPPEPELIALAFDLPGEPGHEVKMLTHYHLPDAATFGPGPHPVLLYAHGRSGDPVERAQLRHPVLPGHVRYWLRKGFAVVAPVRPGYGETGGPDREFSGEYIDANGVCGGSSDFFGMAQRAAHPMRVALDWIREQPWARADHIVLAGQSVGGLTSIALAATAPPGVVGYINFAGGMGGDPVRIPGRSCGADEMTLTMGAFGQTTQVPSLWLYAENDRYWGAEAPRRWHAAFAAGGSASEFIQTAPVPNADGHALLARGGRLWSVHADRFVEQLSAGASAPGAGPAQAAVPAPADTIEVQPAGAEATSKR